MANFDVSSLTQEQLIALATRAMALEAEKAEAIREKELADKKANSSRKLSNGLTVKVSEKGAMSIYGNGRFPQTFYSEQWERIAAVFTEIQAWKSEFDCLLTRKSVDDGDGEESKGKGKSKGTEAAQQVTAPAAVAPEPRLSISKLVARGFSKAQIDAYMGGADLETVEAMIGAIGVIESVPAQVPVNGHPAVNGVTAEF
jgi:hypothetical protein